jgi:pimeloyl-ACP methyl ester carboxylesterase
MEFIPHHSFVAAAGASPTRWMFVLHGILGSGPNFRGFAKRLADSAPDWGFVLVDLRMHGQSLDAPPPHTLASTAADLVRLEERLDGRPIAGIMGHSFGGKVALSFLGQRKRPIDLAFVLDASPGSHPHGIEDGETGRVLRLLESIPQPIPTREEFIARVLAGGQSQAVADWLAMNVRPHEGAFRFRLDLPVVRALLNDYFNADLWSVVEQPPVTRALHFVIAGHRSALDEADRARLVRLAAANPKLIVHELRSAGHWVHVDDPDGLFAAIAPALAGGRESD